MTQWTYHLPQLLLQTLQIVKDLWSGFWIRTRNKATTHHNPKNILKENKNSRNFTSSSAPVTALYGNPNSPTIALYEQEKKTTFITRHILNPNRPKEGTEQSTCVSKLWSRNLCRKRAVSILRNHFFNSSLSNQTK